MDRNIADLNAAHLRSVGVKDVDVRPLYYGPDTPPKMARPDGAERYRSWLLEAFESWRADTQDAQITMRRVIAFIKESEIDGKRYVEPDSAPKVGT